MSNSRKKQNDKRAGVAILFVCGVLLAGFSGYSWYKDESSVMKQTEGIMKQVPNNCYVLFGDKNQTESSANVLYYSDMISNINKTGIKYVYPFIRSASFHLYLFDHCPYFDVTKHKLPSEFNKTLAQKNQLPSNSSIWDYVFDTIDTQHDKIIYPSSWLIDQELAEQKLHDYNLAQNSNDFPRIENIAGAFHMSLPQVIDKLFWEGAVDIDQCVNPSWRPNSEIRQCTYHDSHFIVDKNTEQLLGILDQPLNKTGTTKPT